MTNFFARVVQKATAASPLLFTNRNSRDFHSLSKRTERADSPREAVILLKDSASSETHTDSQALPSNYRVSPSNLHVPPSSSPLPSISNNLNVFKMSPESNTTTQPQNQFGGKSYAIMPRPGQPGALSFNGENVSKFVVAWEMDCSDFGLDEEQKCTRLAYYCTKTVESVVKHLPGYIAKDWEALKKDLRSLYWDKEEPDDTNVALQSLIQSAKKGEIALNAYILQYETISQNLVRDGALSKMDQVLRFLDGLSNEMRTKVLQFIARKEWTLSSQDVNTKQPDFTELREFVSHQAAALQLESVYNRERGIRETIPMSASKVTPASPWQSAPTSPISIASDPAVLDLANRLERLTLLVESKFMSGPQPVSLSPVVTPESSFTVPRRISPMRCMWCDSMDHTRRNCEDFGTALKNKLVRFNENGRIANAATGEEFKTNYGKGGMKVLLGVSPSTGVNTASALSITLEPMLARLGDGNSLQTTVDFVERTRMEEVIDVSIEEKRRREDQSKFDRRVRPRTKDPSESEQQTTPSLNDSNPIQVDITEPTDNHTASLGKKHPQYRYASELSKKVNISEIGEKIMDTPIQLRLRELFATSPDVATYIHEQTRKRRVPIEIAPETGDTNLIVANVRNSQYEYEKSYYALPSGRAKVSVDGRLVVDAILDPGSELNIIPRRVFERLNIPIDNTIRWRVNGFDTDTAAAIEFSNPIGVCHDVPINVGGVEVKQQIFVVEHCNSDLLLGRPWDRSTRAQYINGDDGSLMVIIKAPDGKRQVEFMAIPGQHERNREYVREDNLNN